MTSLKVNITFAQSCKGLLKEGGPKFLGNFSLTRSHENMKLKFCVHVNRHENIVQCL